MNLNNVILKQQAIKDQQRFIKKHESDINGSKEVVHCQNISHHEKFAVNNGFVTTCLSCNQSCHGDCFVSNVRDCPMMNSDGYCKVCSCPASYHKNADYEFRQVIKQLRTSNWDANSHLKDSYYKATQNKQHALNRIKSLENELKKLEEDLKNKVAMVENLQNELKMIALRPKLSTFDDYIDEMISNEKELSTRDNKKIQLLERLKKQEKILEKIEAGNDVNEILYHLKI